MKSELKNQIQKWLDSKKSSTIDIHQICPYLDLLKTDAQIQMMNQTLELILILRCSYSEGLKILELVTEIVLIYDQQKIQIDFDMLTTHHEQKMLNPDQWLTRLNQLRFPLTMQNDTEIKLKLEKLPWPFGSKIKFERRGDRSGVELKVFISNPSDLVKIISSLERVREGLQKNET